MTEAAIPDDAKIPTVTLAGKEWPVPELVWVQLKRCRRAILDLQALLNASVRASDAAAPEDEGPLEAAGRRMGSMAGVLNSLSDDEYERLVVSVLYVALTGAHPQLSRAEFDAWPTTETERQMAWLVVRQQSLLFVAAGSAGAPSADDEDEDPGEVRGAA